ncbi:MAG: hypothetical protein HYZ00_11980, partial [Candidatus Hydrogenedentes bacterium]|nr:hypothetical protein [Candidatus Hydrogenedentota bacterium]
KQLLRLTSATETMLHEAVRRIEPVTPRQHIYIQTMEHLINPIRKAEVGVPAENVIAEPCKRNTAGCLIYAVAHLLAKYGTDPATLSMAVLTADHIIGSEELFRKTVVNALEAAEREAVLVTIGVKPTRPASGYGYIQTSAAEQGQTVLPVQAFHEKPDLETAQRYVAAGNYYWNAGMFFWRISTFLDELRQAQPAMAARTVELRDALQALDTQRAHQVFQTLENTSIDYALMEKARRVAMAPANFPWDDIGTWAALDRTRQPDTAGNITEGGPVLVECRDCIVYNAEGADGMSVAVVGADNLVVVVTKDGVLVAPKDRTEDVKKAVQELELRNARQV